MVEPTAGESRANQDENSEDTACGIYCGPTLGEKRKRYIGKNLQQFATPKWALAFIALAGFTQGFVISGITNASISTLEKRFGLQSQESGLIVSTYSISTLLSILLVTYKGGKGHKPKWIACGLVVMSLGSFLFTLPHFVAPTNTLMMEGNTSLLCNSSNGYGLNDHLTSVNSYKYMLMAAMLLMGSGVAPLITLGLTYLDENVPQSQSSMYHGVFATVSSAFGPAAGTFCGSSLLQISAGLDMRLDDTVNKNTWVGAWWIGYIIAGGLFLIFSLPIFLLPRILPGTAAIRRSRETVKDQHTSNEEKTKRARLEVAARKFAFVLINPSLLLTVSAASLDFGLIMALGTFVPKYLENVFNLLPDQAALYHGTLAIGAAIIGLLAGGGIITKAKLNVVSIYKLCIVCTFLSGLFGAAFFISCPQQSVAGVYTQQGLAVVNQSRNTSSCAADCVCDRQAFDPVCGQDGITYLSPCVAGCQDQANEKYLNCPCISNAGNGSNLQTSITGRCVDKNCTNFVPFMMVYMCMIVFTFACWTPNLQTVIRIVKFHHRSLAVGIQVIVRRILGGIPFPIVVGSLLDASCLSWGTVGAGSLACNVYSNRNCSLVLFVAVVCAKTLTFTFYCLALYLNLKMKKRRRSQRDRGLEDGETMETGDNLDTQINTVSEAVSKSTN